MNYIEVKGGLGNQLFQYAFYRYCEKKSVFSVLLYTDFYKYCKFVKGATIRDFGLDKYNCDFVGIDGHIICNRKIDERQFKEADFKLDETFYSGYWQRKDFFEAVRTEILSELSLKPKYISEELKNLA